MKDKEKTFKDVIGVFAIIGMLSTFIFVVKLFNPEDTDNICGAYLEKIDELETEIVSLNEEIDGLEYQKLELEFDLDEVTEERDFYLDYYEEKEGIEWPKLTDGAKK